MSTRVKFIILGLLVALGVVGCSPVVEAEQAAVVETVLLDNGSIGQTFVSHYDGLEGIDLYLEPVDAGTGTLHLQLRSDSLDTENLGVGSLPLENVSSPGFYHVTFPPQRDSTQQYYYLLLRIKGQGSVNVGTAPGDAYINGALYRNHQPQDAQLAFNLIYSPRLLTLGLAGEALTWLGYLLAAAFLFIIPGWALLGWVFGKGSKEAGEQGSRGAGGQGSGGSGGQGSRDAGERGSGERGAGRGCFTPGSNLPDTHHLNLAMCSWATKLALSAGVSLAIYPLLLLFTDLVGLHLGALYAWLPPIIGIIVIVWRNREWLNVNTLKRFRIPLPSAADVSLIIVLALVFAVRFWVIRTLDAPMWGDSYQHTMMAQLMLDNGGLFNSWEPYAALSTFTYHFGFHTLVAIFSWLTRIPTHLSTLWIGQILNGLAVLSLYPLATRIGKSRWAGTAAVAIAGLLSPMPMYYTNWGRYTQLAGQVILPAIIFIIILIVNTNTPNWKQRGLSWLILGGLALTHYRVLIFAILFFPLVILINARKKHIRKTIIEMAWIGIGAGLLFLPWFIHVFAGTILDILNAQLSTPAKDVSQFTQQYNSIGNLLSYLPMTIWLLLPIAIGWGLWKRNREHVLISLWSFMILLAANPGWLQLPGSGALSNFAVVIAAYIPSGIILGAASGWIARDLVKINRIWKNILLATVVCVISIFGARQRLSDIYPSHHALVTRPDTLAASWIHDNIHDEARFLVNSFFAYGDSVIVGADGGWWLPLLTGRDTTLPPLPYGSEQGPLPNYRVWVNELTQTWNDKGIAHPDTLEMFSQREITHIYMGQQQGRVNYNGPHVLPSEQMLADPHFHLVYRQDRVWIFEIIQ